MSWNTEFVAKWFDSVRGVNYNPEVIHELAAYDIFTVNSAVLKRYRDAE